MDPINSITGPGIRRCSKDDVHMLLVYYTKLEGSRRRWCSGLPINPCNLVCGRNAIEVILYVSIIPIGGIARNPKLSEGVILRKVCAGRDARLVIIKFRR